MDEAAARPGPRPVAPQSKPEDPPTQALVPATQALATQRAGTMQQAFEGLMPTSMGEVHALSTYLAKSEAIPGSMKGKPDTVFTIVWAGMELGLTPIRALQSISNISGTLCMKADLQLALAKSRAVLAFYEEGFEEHGKTDKNLADRILLTFKLAKVIPDYEDQAALAVQKITSVTSELKAGNPYGWSMGMRAGEQRIHVRTFTFADAERAMIYEKDESGNGPKERKPLSQKFNYKSFPGDMYPKRARTRLLQIIASDVTNGLPAVEAMEGQVFDAEFSRVEDDPGGESADTLLAAIQVDHPELATAISQGFKQLSMNPAKQLLKLNQFKGKPDQLLDWLKTEYANRKGVPRKQEDVLGQQPAQAEPVQEGQVIDQAAQDQTPQAPTEPPKQPPPPVQPPPTVPPVVEPPKESKRAGKTADLAARFKAGSTF